MRVRILIADDHETDREYVKAVLGYAGYEVLEAEHGEAALSMVRAERPDLVLIDILMPKLDGLEVVRRIRTQPEIAGTRVIMWSATFRQAEAQTMAVALGVARLVRKPVEPQSLLATVDEVLRAPPASQIAPGVLSTLEEAHQRLLGDKLFKKTLELEEEIKARRRLEDEARQLNEDLERLVAERTAELTRANEALVKSNEELRQFAFVASHDLQTPLRSIAGFAQLLQKEYGSRLDAHADDLIGHVVDNARRMHQLIRDLLVYARVDSRACPFEPIPLQQIFDDVIRTLGASIRDSEAKVEGADLPVVLGDRSQLTQLLQNLIENAIKYRAKRPPRVRVSAQRQDSTWVFSVRDNGIGIDTKHHQRIFEIFHRLHTQRAYPGTGMGLAICRRIVERHGGRIWVESEPEEGSNFCFSLPALAANSDASRASPLP